MENWGLVTYRQAYLLYSEDRKELIASFIGHELAHMVSSVSL